MQPRSAALASFNPAWHLLVLLMLCWPHSEPPKAPQAAPANAAPASEEGSAGESIEIQDEDVEGELPYKFIGR